MRVKAASSYSFMRNSFVPALFHSIANAGYRPIVAQLLLVEDDSAIRDALIRALSERGHAVASTPTAMAALQQVLKAPPDAVLLDLGLPDLSGQEALRMIRSVSTVPVLVITARDDEAEIVRALDAGADDYVVKPFGGGPDRGPDQGRPAARRGGQPPDRGTPQGWRPSAGRGGL